ncbi:MAG: hypothetical protein PW788_02400 [Micavibrio sp.]|nr:hypothetical protein [Micavibrio sp.]
MTMFNKIGEMLNPANSRQQGGGQGQRGGSQARQQAPAADTAFGDTIFLSIDALRALVREDKSLVKQADELLRRLAQLEQHGLQMIPLSAGQPAAQAITEAFSFLKS